MKGANYYTLTARHLFLTLVTLIFTTIYLLVWEWLSFGPTQLSATKLSEDARENFGSPLVKEWHDSLNDSASMNPKENFDKSSSQSITTEETQETMETFGSPSMNPKENFEKSNFQSITTEETQETMETFGSPPMNLTPLYPPESIYSGAKNTYSPKAEACDYANGRWVVDNRKPLYSPTLCTQLSKMWSCRQTHRTDFSYEQYKWQPMNCEMPQFDHLAFLSRMQDKTIAFMGDSLGRQQFQSLMCMLTGRKKSPKVEDVGDKYGLFKPYGAIRGAVKGAGWAYSFPNTNTTILMYWSVSLCELEALNMTEPARPVAIHLDRPAAFLRQSLHLFDILVLNTGHHWNKEKFEANRWVMHVNGKPNRNKKLSEFRVARNFTVHKIVKWLDSQLPLHPHLKVFFRTISPTHFSNGKWNTGGSCDNTVPFTRGSHVLQNRSMDYAVEGAVKGTGVKILDITALSDLRNEAHISHYRRNRQGMKINDCLHWCLPGVPDSWNQILFALV